MSDTKIKEITVRYTLNSTNLTLKNSQFVPLNKKFTARVGILNSLPKKKPLKTLTLQRHYTL